MLARIFFSIVLGIALPSLAFAQSNPGLIKGQVPTAAQWNSYFSSKQDNLGFIPMNSAGGIFSGKITTIASAAAGAPLNIPPGAAPTSPINGDVWTTSSGLFVRAGGVSIGPFAPLISPAFSGVPTAPTATFSTNTMQLATTEFVQAAVVGSIAGVANIGGTTGAIALSGLAMDTGTLYPLLPFSTSTATGPITGTQKAVLCDATSTSVVLTIPAPASVRIGTVIMVERKDSSANNCSVAISGGSLIGGLSAWGVAPQFASFTFRSDGTNWRVE